MSSSPYESMSVEIESPTRAIARFAADWQPHVFADVRSGDRYMAMPYASKGAAPSDRSDRGGMRDAGGMLEFDELNKAMRSGIAGLKAEPSPRPEEELAATPS